MNVHVLYLHLSLTCNQPLENSSALIIKCQPLWVRASGKEEGNRAGRAWVDIGG
jgi:hypothetical protein